jgi:hypothetical protein
MADQVITSVPSRTLWKGKLVLDENIHGYSSHIMGLGLHGTESGTRCTMHVPAHVKIFSPSCYIATHQPRPKMCYKTSVHFLIQYTIGLGPRIMTIILIGV